MIDNEKNTVQQPDDGDNLTFDSFARIGNRRNQCKNVRHSRPDICRTAKRFFCRYEVLRMQVDTVRSLRLGVGEGDWPTRRGHSTKWNWPSSSGDKPCWTINGLIVPCRMWLLYGGRSTWWQFYAGNQPTIPSLRPNKWICCCPSYPGLSMQVSCHLVFDVDPVGRACMGMTKPIIQ